MKNKIIRALMLISYSVINAQIGVNTTTPKATLDIIAKNSTGTSPKPEGIIIPRVDRQKAQSMTGIDISTLIYVNSITTGTLTGTAVNIDAVGYYYFNGTAWVKLNAGSLNIYNSNGTLTGNRKVTQNANTLAFTSTAVNGFSVDGNTFSVDAANHRLGIGTNNPEGLFEVVADNRGNLEGNNIYFKGFGSSKEPALIFASANGTQASPVDLDQDDFIGSIYFTPRINNLFPVTDGSAIQSFYRGDGASSLTDLIFRTSDTERLRINEIGNVGITNDMPTAKLDIIGDGTFAPIRARDIQVSNVTTYADKQTLQPVVIDDNGVMVKKFSPVSLENSYSFDGEISVSPGGAAVPIVTNIYGVVIFKFVTNFSFGDNNSSMLYGQVSFTERNGFQVANDWSYSGNSVSPGVNLVGIGTHTLTFDYGSGPDLILSYDTATATAFVSKTVGGVVTDFMVFDGMKLR
jgi:hypothetical protein